MENKKLTSNLQKGDRIVSENMKDLLQAKDSLFVFPKVGDILEGKVIEKGRNRIFVDLGNLRLGVVYKNEIDLSMYDVQNIKVGELLPVKILELENNDSLIELSLKEAGLDKVWQEFSELKEKGETFPVTVQDANRGGLIIQLHGIQGFLPVSQLSPEHYPHVEGGDKEEILQHLKSFVGKELEVKILDLDRKTAKLILSERAKASRETKEKLAKYTVGQIIEGEISGIVDFGAFITFEGIEGLVHISELGWQLVESPANMVNVGDKVQAKIIAIENDKVSLSLKALKLNPWDAIGEKYKKGDLIEGLISRYNPFGAFVRVEPEIQGLAHISEFKNYEDMIARLKIGEKYTFRITMLEPKEYKMALRLIDLEKETSTDSDIISEDSPDDVRETTSIEENTSPKEEPTS
jgi:small subunit ribosomal protein S1